MQQELIRLAMEGTTYMNAALTYFPGDGLSSHFTTPGGIPLTSYRYNCVGSRFRNTSMLRRTSSTAFTR